MDPTYGQAYFASGIFDQNYDIMADRIVATYAPRTALDVGCGPAHLSKALAARGVAVTALDGHSRQDVSGTSITFHECDLNSSAALERVAGKFKATFDVAICLEVAEHLQPEASDALIAFLCAQAPVVVFSAGIPGQGGNGHINCQAREAWHDRFRRHHFHLAHQLRPRLQDEPTVASWYRYNLLDYRRAPIAASEQEALVRSLIATESRVTSELYRQGDELNRLRSLLSYRPVRAYLRLRAWAKTLRRR
jgi:SAM-dependent methyltransferase